MRTRTRSLDPFTAHPASETSLPRLARALAGLAFLSTMAGCATDGDRTPAADGEISGLTCQDSGTCECVSNAACGEGAICDYNYLCSPTPSGVQCSEPSGDQMCHELCEGTCPIAGQECVEIEQFQGGDSSQTFKICR